MDYSLGCNWSRRQWIPLFVTTSSISGLGIDGRWKQGRIYIPPRCPVVLFPCNYFNNSYRLPLGTPFAGHASWLVSWSLYLLDIHNYRLNVEFRTTSFTFPYVINLFLRINIFEIGNIVLILIISLF